MPQNTAQVTTVVPGWVTELYDAMETMDLDRMLAQMSQDVTIKFINAEPIVGQEAFRAARSGPVGAIRGMHHDFLHVWECGDATMLVAEVTYTLLDGSQMSLPCSTLVFRRTDGKITSMQTFMDMSPVFARAAALASESR